MSILADFKTFALRGNLVDMAVGFTVGAAFSTIAKSLVDNIIMPPIAFAMGSADFTDLFFLLKAGTPPPPYPTLAAAQKAGAITINYGLFINNIIAFILIAVAMFILLRAITRLDKELEERFAEKTSKDNEQAANKKCSLCLSTIPFQATKCAFCTADLGDNTHMSAEKISAS